MKFLIVLAISLAFTSAVDLNKERIINGNTAKNGQFFHLAGLSLQSYDGKYTWCGGSLIGRQWILTAAHCLIGIANVTVYLGGTTRNNAETTFTVSNENFISHAQLDTKKWVNDIALIKIKAVKLSKNIQTIILPSMNTQSSWAGQNVIAAGWGFRSDKDTIVGDDLKWAKLKIITNDECYKSFTFVQPAAMCAFGDNGQSTCKGDSGGSITLESNGLLLGVSSFVSTYGCEKGWPIGAARVTSFLEWIKEHTGIWY